MKGHHRQEQLPDETEKILYLDCFSGISGDMLLGALLDAGLALEDLKKELSLLDLPEYSLRADTVNRHGITGTDVKVDIEGTPPLRSLSRIEEIIKESKLKQEVKEKSLYAFRMLGEVEASVHGVSLEEVHFHEIGAVDTIVDIAGTAAALDLLGINKVISSPIPMGRGYVEIAHGTYPLPAPATAAIISQEEIPVYGVETRGELVTPTGAALLATLVDEFGEIPAFSPCAVGYGAGKKDFGAPNFLRAWIGKVQNNTLNAGDWEVETAAVIEANIDDLNPEISGHVLEKVMREGALDAYYTSVQMKKSRPAVKLSILAPPSLCPGLVETVFQETSTLGCRVTGVKKVMLPRRTETVETPWGVVRVKVAVSNGEFMHFSPEYEDCQAISVRENIPLKEIYRRIEAEYSRRIGRNKG